jgi:hypothetical protein
VLFHFFNFRESSHYSHCAHLSWLRCSHISSSINSWSNLKYTPSTSDPKYRGWGEIEDLRIDQFLPKYWRRLRAGECQTWILDQYS